MYKVTIRMLLDGGLKITSKHEQKAYNDVINLNAEQAPNVMTMFKADFALLANHLQLGDD